jgi:hypothetical protein
MLVLTREIKQGIEKQVEHRRPSFACLSPVLI